MVGSRSTAALTPTLDSTIIGRVRQWERFPLLMGTRMSQPLAAPQILASAQKERL